MSALAIVKCYERRWEVVIPANLVETNGIDGDSHLKYRSTSFSVSSLYWVLRKRLELVLTCVS